MGNGPSSDSAPPPPPPHTNAPPSGEAPGSPAFHIGSVLGRPMEDVHCLYLFEEELGRGRFGVTWLAIHRHTGERFACKRIAKRRLLASCDLEDVRREVQIMHHLTGHSNVAELRDAYEDHDAVYLLMELCEGGELFDRIIAKGRYTEKAAAALFRQIAVVVHTCHSMGVMHRDLKPENFLFLNKDEDAPLKAVDFGLSVFFKPGEKHQELVGSAYYIAPEVLRCNYGKEADVWSAGVILYILLSGVPPFWAQNDREIFESIIQGNLDFSSDPWPSISSSGKELIQSMLQQDPNKRISISEVLNHPWVRENGEAPDDPIDITVLKRMKQFRAMNKLKKLALKVIAENLLDEEVEGLRNIFQSIDTDDSGTITFDELKAGLPKLGTKVTESEVQQIMEGADVDGNGMIDYIEFLTATMHASRMDREDRLCKAFEYFDKDNSGFITMDEIEQALKKYNMGDEQTIKDIIAEVDTNKDGKINYDEFVTMMKKGNTEMPGQLFKQANQSSFSGNHSPDD